MEVRAVDLVVYSHDGILIMGYFGRGYGRLDIILVIGASKGEGKL